MRQRDTNLILVRVLSVLVVIALGVVGWLGYRYLTREKNDPGEPTADSTAHHTERREAIDTDPAKPAEFEEPRERSRDEVKEDIKGTKDRIDLSRVWDKDKRPLARDLRQGNADLYLKWLYLSELSRLQGASRVGGKVADEMRQELAAVRQAIVEEKPETKNYNQSYVQWYELICLSHDPETQKWNPGGEAAQKLDGLVKLVGQLSWTAKPAEEDLARMRVDGSTLSAMMYTVLTLYYANDRPAGEGLVGAALGVPFGVSPRENPTPAENRALVKMLSKATRLIEEAYPEGISTKKLGLRYFAGERQKEYLSLVGGKILYFNSKAVLAFQRSNPLEEKLYLDKGYEVMQGLEREGFPLSDTYDYSYVMRATAVLIRAHLARNERPRVASLTRMAKGLLAREVRGEWSSKYYLPLIYLQFRNELDDAGHHPNLN